MGMVVGPPTRACHCVVRMFTCRAVRYFALWDDGRSCFCTEDFHVGVDDPKAGLVASGKMLRRGNARGSAQQMASTTGDAHSH
jgi:hypothetical protein